MSTIGELVVKISGDNTDLNQALNESAKDSSKFASTMTSAFASVGAAAGVLALAVKGIEFNKAAEQAKVAFTVMTGSAEKATSTLKKLKDFADKTPLEFKDLREATQTLIQFGIGADDAVELIKDLGDVSGGNAEKLKSLSLAFGQMSATGRLMGQDLNQMINAGFNPLLQISEDTGESMKSLKEKMEAGAISTQMVRDAFTSATSEGGRFYGMLELQAETLAGKQSTLNDAFESFLGKMTEAANGPLKAGATLLTNILNAVSALPGPVLNAAGAFTAVGSALVAATGAARVLGITLSASMGPIGLIIAGVTAGIVLLSSAIMGAVQEQENLNKAMDKTSKLSNQERIDILEKEKLKLGEQITTLQRLKIAEERQFGIRTIQYEKYDKEILQIMKRQGELSVIQQDASAKIKESAKKEAEANKVVIATIDETKEAKKEAADLEERLSKDKEDREQWELENFIAREEAKLDKELENIKFAEEGSKAWRERLKKAQEEQLEYEIELADAQVKTQTDAAVLIGEGFDALYEDLNKQAYNYEVTIKTIAGSISGAMSASLKEIGKQILEGGGSWKSFAKIGLNALSSILDAIGAQLAAMGVVKLLMLDFVGAAAAAAGSAAAYISSGLVSSQAAQYAKGTSFHPGGAALVGEFGAELIQLPRGSSVATAQETRNIMNNTTSNAPVFNFFSPEALDPAEMEKRFILSQREAAYMGVFA